MIVLPKCYPAVHLSCSCWCDKNLKSVQSTLNSWCRLSTLKKTFLRSNFLQDLRMRHGFRFCDQLFFSAYKLAFKVFLSKLNKYFEFTMNSHFWAKTLCEHRLPSFLSSPNTWMMNCRWCIAGNAPQEILRIYFRWSIKSSLDFGRTITICHEQPSCKRRAVPDSIKSEGDCWIN